MIYLILLYCSSNTQNTCRYRDNCRKDRVFLPKNQYKYVSLRLEVDYPLKMSRNSSSIVELETLSKSIIARYETEDPVTS